MYQAIPLELTTNSSLIVQVWSFIIYSWLNIIPLQRQNRTKYRLLIVPSIINEQRELWGWNLIKFVLKGILEISTMILTERFTCKNTKRLLHPKLQQHFCYIPKASLAMILYTSRTKTWRQVYEYFKIVIFPSVITISLAKLGKTPRGVMSLSFEDTSL